MSGTAARLEFAASHNSHTTCLSEMALQSEEAQFLKNVPFFVRLHHKLGLCYTLGMNFDHQIWDRWAETLYRWGLRDFAASFLEAAGPLTILGAQVVYILQPILGRWSQSGSLPHLAALLEQPDQVREFVHFLREEPLK